MKVKFLAIYLFLVMNLSYCSVAEGLLGSMNKPTISLKSVDLKKITLEDINLKLLTQIKNPYPIALPRSDLKMKLMIEDNLLSNISTDLGKIAAKDSQDVPFDLQLKYNDLKRIYQSFPGKQILGVKMDGLISLPIPKNYQVAGKESFDFPFQESKDIPAILPNIEIKNFQMVRPDPAKIMSSVNTAQVGQAALNYIDSLLGGKKTSVGSAVSQGLSNVDINIDTLFDIVLSNQAAATINFSDLKYDLSLQGEKFLAGAPEQIQNNGKESIVKVKTSFPLKSLSEGIANAIQRRSSDFHLKGNSNLKVPGITEKIDFDYDKKGNFKW